MLTRATYPIWIALASAILWGLWWIPIRAIETSGLSGIWASVAMNVGALPLLLIAFFVGSWPGPTPLRSFIGAGFVGGAVMLYGAAITETTVVRAVLLFYLAPAWSVAIECLFFGRRFRWFNALAFLLAVSGVLLIFGGKLTLSGWVVGDSMAVGSGMSWSIGASLIFSSGKISVRKLALSACVTAIVIGTFAAVLLEFRLPGAAIMASSSSLAVASGTVYFAPVLLATLWAARILTPATITFLLTAEIISGVLSSALLLDEPAGIKEFSGAALIAAAALIEVLIPAQIRAPETDVV